MMKDNKDPLKLMRDGGFQMNPMLKPDHTTVFSFPMKNGRGVEQT